MNENNLLLIRKERGLGTVEVARLLGLNSHTVYSKIENGKRQLTAPIAESFSSALKVSNRYFFNSPTILNSDDAIMYLKETMEFCGLVEVKDCIEIKNRKPVIKFNPSIRDAFKKLKNHWGDMDYILATPRAVAETNEKHRGLRAKTIRERRGISKHDLCEKANIDFNLYNKFESGIVDLSYTQLRTVASVLDTTSSQLLDRFYINSSDDVLQFFCQLILSRVEYEIDADGGITFADRKINAFLKEFFERSAQNLPYEFLKWWCSV